MIRFFFCVFFFLASAAAASATTCTIPATLSNGTIVDANALNGNFVSLQSCGNNIDTTNIGTAGIQAAQIKPTTTLQAIFGGTVVYAFQNGLNVTGTLAAGAVTASSLVLTAALPTTSGGTGNTTGLQRMSRVRFWPYTAAPG